MVIIIKEDSFVRPLIKEQLCVQFLLYATVLCFMNCNK